MTKARRPGGPSGILKFPRRFAAYCRNPIDYLTQLARQYGDLIALPFPGFRFCLVSHPDSIEEVLRQKQRIFKKDYPGYKDPVFPVFGDGLLTSDGDRWRRKRMAALPAFQPREINQYTGTMIAFGERSIAKWRADETRDIHVDMARLTLEVATKTLFDVDVVNDPAWDNIGEDLSVLLAYFANPITMWPAWQRFPLPMNRRFFRSLARIDAVMYGMIRQRRADGLAGRVDYLSLALQAEDEHDPKTADKQVRDDLMTMLIAAHETTAVALTYTFRLLSQNPAADAQLAAELQRVLGDRPVTADDIPNLPYTECVFKEAMRLYPPVWIMGREASEDCEIRGVAIAKGTQVLISPWIVQRDPQFWGDAEDFRPERWEEPAIADLPRCAYIPFGDGPRTCLGKAFAMIEGVLLLATIARQYRFELVPNQTLKLVPTVTLRPNGGTKMVVRQRRNNSLAQSSAVQREQT